MNGWFKLTALGAAAILALLSGCSQPRARKRVPDPYFLDQRMDTLERHLADLKMEVSRLSEGRRERERLELHLNAVERKLDRLAEHPWFAAIQENPLGALPPPSKGPPTPAGRRPPPEMPSARVPEGSDPSAPAGGPSAAERGEASPITRLARILSPPSIRERTADELFRLGRRYFEAGELSSAVEKLALYLERSKEGGRADEALMLIGRAELARGRTLAAAESFQRVLVLSPESSMRPEALWRAGVSFRRLNDKVSALKLWKELTERYPSHPLAAEAADSIRQMATER